MENHILLYHTFILCPKRMTFSTIYMSRNWNDGEVTQLNHSMIRMLCIKFVERISK